MKRSFGRALAIGIAAIAMVGIAGTQPHAALASRPAATAQAPVKLVHNTKMGTIITNSKGMTLYYYTPDKAGKPTCTGGCAQAWPPALKASSARFGKLPVSGKFGTVKGAEGGRQITYNGWPLYTFVGDKKPGQTNGQGLQNVWFVATPKLKRAAASGAAPAPTVTCTPSAYGC